MGENSVKTYKMRHLAGVGVIAGNMPERLACV